ncbi:MBL fold metallo-hydrolase [Deminuibacter soli]|uniref:MBL fold metallo-hydrolase n=1 Tax=Deminuibacter soli TaxID=2291815 RepID=A0A3E1NPQ6_9BACT|nr:MBL fold metallo-hydrolase [Deminuibacter soli]RFM29916.1 MBL fold metallo-hydrolase [Deminuibacter soli]
MKIIPLSEGEFTIDKSKVFVPFNKENDDLQARATGSLLVEVQPFVVITEKDILLIDTGLGFMKDGELQLHANLKANGINPGEITKVLMSHLHKDHAGGVSVRDRFGDYRLSFPAATYYVQQQELEYALEIGTSSYIADEVRELQDAKNVVLLHGDGEIDGYIRYQVTGAHSKYHQVFWITEKDETVFFGGDDAPQFGQMKNRFVAKYDYDGKKCMELRKQWWEEGQAAHWTFLFYHDVKTPFVKA